MIHLVGFNRTTIDIPGMKDDYVLGHIGRKHFIDGYVDTICTSHFHKPYLISLDKGEATLSKVDNPVIHPAAYDIKVDLHGIGQLYREGDKVYHRYHEHSNEVFSKEVRTINTFSFPVLKSPTITKQVSFGKTKGEFVLTSHYADNLLNHQWTHTRRDREVLLDEQDMIIIDTHVSEVCELQFMSDGKGLCYLEQTTFDIIANQYKKERLWSTHIENESLYPENINRHSSILIHDCFLAIDVGYAGVDEDSVGEYIKWVSITKYGPDGIHTYGPFKTI